MQKIFKKVPGFAVEVSAWGDIRRIKDGYIHSPQSDRLNYRRVQINPEDGGKRCNISVHRAVAMAWIPNPLNHSDVNHIDGDKENNHYTNLEWCTRSQNQKHAYRTGLNKGKKKESKRELITLARAAGWEISDIADAFECSETNIRQYLRLIAEDATKG